MVADVADLWALERAEVLNARYHVLGGTLSPLDGIGPQDLTIDALVSRAHDPAVKEVILALNATVDGQTTAHYITDLLHDANVVGDAARAWRAGRRRARLSRRGHAVGGDPQPHAALTVYLAICPDIVLPAGTDISDKILFQDCGRRFACPRPLGAALLTVSLTAGGRRAPTSRRCRARSSKPGLKKADCTVPPEQAEIVGTERLSSRLEIVEVACWRDRL